MKKSRGPAKVLAPALAPENICAHEFTALEGLQLEVDCEKCGGAQELLARGCMIGVMNAIAHGALPETVVLKRFMHIRYRGDAVRTVVNAATELSALTRAMRPASTVSDRRCRTCPCSGARLVPQLRAALLDDPAGYVREPRRAESVIAEATRRASCERHTECAARVRAMSTVASGRS